MKLLVLTALTLGFPLLQQQPYLRARGPKGEFDIENFGHFDLVPNSAKLSLTGNPLQVFWRDAGLSITSQSLDGDLGNEPTEGTFLKSATISGNAVATWDTDAAQAFAVERAREDGTTVPPATGKKRLFTISSPSFAYAGDFTVGTVTVPSDFSGTWAIHGSELVKAKNAQAQTRIFDDSGQVHGSSATIELFTHAVGPTPLRKGTIAGPVTFKFVRHSTLDGAQESPKTVDGKADRMDFDFLGAVHTITVTGNVTFLFTSDVPVKKEMKPATASVSATKAVLTLGPDGQIEKFDMDGTPTVTNVKPLKSGGGR